MGDQGTSDQPDDVVNSAEAGQLGGNGRAHDLAGDAVPDPGLTRRKRVGLVVGIVALIAAVLFAVFTLLPRAKSPEDVVEDFFAAIEDEDLLGAAASILPSERRFIVEPLFDGLDEAERLRILTEVNVEDLQGVDLEFGKLTYEVETLADDLVWVAVSGDVTSGVRPEDLPVGSLLIHFLPENWAEEIGEDPRDVASIGQNFGLAVVKDDGDWYVSPTYTIAEAARREAGVAFPVEQPFAEPRGAATPEEALERAALAIAGIDLRGLVDVIVPAETAAFRRYAQLFIDDWDSGVADLRSSMAEVGFSYSVDVVVAGSARQGDDTVAWIKDVLRFRAAVDVPDVGMLSIDREGDCLTIDVPEAFIDAFQPFSGEGEIDFSQFDGEDCVDFGSAGDAFNPDASDPFQGQEELFFELPMVGPLVERWSESLENLGDVGASAVQFQVEEIDGRWYVSPAGTINRWILGFTKTLDEALLTEVGDEIQQSIEEPEVFEQRMQDWLTKVGEAGLLDPFGGFGVPIGGPDFGPEVLAPFAERANVLLVWDFDTEFVTNQIEEIYGSGIVVEVIDGPDLHGIFLAALGPGATGGLPPDEFPGGILIAPVDIDTLVEIFNWSQILDMYVAADLGLG